MVVIGWMDVIGPYWSGAHGLTSVCIGSRGLLKYNGAKRSIGYCGLIMYAQSLDSERGIICYEAQRDIYT